MDNTVNNMLITGGNGFLAKELALYFSNNSEINLISTNRSTLDIANAQQVNDFFNLNNIDIVIHTAVKGGKRNQQENIDDFFSNISMFNNLLNCSNKYKMLFNFGSGAEFDRFFNISLAKEESIFNHRPVDYYGLSKNFISRKISELDSRYFNLRLFGCFGHFEEPQRLIRASFDNIQNGKPIAINQDKFMDYFYAQDVGKVIEHIIQSNKDVIPRDINLCYEKKYKLTDISNMILDLTGNEESVIIKKETLGKPYTGCGKKLKGLNIDLLGIHKGIDICLKNWKKS